MIAAGVIDAVVAILKANLDYCGIQANGIVCLGNLACHNNAAKVRPVLLWDVTIPVVFYYTFCVFFFSYAGYHRECRRNSTDFGSDETISGRRRDA